MTTKAKEELVIHFQPFKEKPEDSRWGIARYRYRGIDFATKEGDSILGLSSSGFSDYSELAGLELTAVIKWSDNKWEVFGYSCDYRSRYCIEYQDAVAMVKVFKRLQRIYDKWIVRPQSFGQYVAMIARDMGIKQYAKRIGQDNGYCNQNEYQFLGISYLAGEIDASIEEARKRLVAQAEVA